MDFIAINLFAQYMGMCVLGRVKSEKYIWRPAVTKIGQKYPREVSGAQLNPNSDDTPNPNFSWDIIVSYFDNPYIEREPKKFFLIWPTLVFMWSTPRVN